VIDLEVERPFDLLQKAKNRRVLIELLDGRKFSGIFKSFDSYLNIVLEDVELDNGIKLSFVFLKSIHGIIVI